MLLGPNSFNVSTAVLIAGALWVVYLRYRNVLNSNLPLLYYSIMIVYANSVEGRLPHWVVYTGLVLGLLLRYEFMNQFFTQAVKRLEYLMLAIIVYNCMAMILRL